MKEVFSLKTFWVIFILAVAAIFVMVINTSRVYESTTSLLVIPKSPAAVKNADQILDNLRQLPLTLSFYEKMVQENADVADDATLELPDYKRKALWVSQLRVERVTESGVLQIIATDGDRYRAEILSAQAAKTLMSSISLYYDIRTDLDVRIIDPTVTDYSAGAVDYILLLESIVGVFAVIFGIFFASLNLFKGKRESSATRPNIFSAYDNPFFSRENAKEMPEKEDMPVAEKKAADQFRTEWSLPTEEKPYTDFINLNKVSNAPANLPIAPANLPIAEEEEFPESLQTESKELPAEAEEEIMEELPVIETETTPITREATPEEVKARLNKLLSGKL